MSLHQIAKHVQSKGRGRDTMLVHMSPREVAGLQALAMAHGGKLSINPDTGLPEAGFLEQVLPVVAAGALTYFTAGAATPLLGEALAGTALAGAEGLLAGAGIGALVGGGMSALQGGNFGRGALMGGIGGGIAGGLGAFGGPSPFDVPTAPTVPEVPVAPGAPAPTVTPTPTPTPTPIASTSGGTFAPPVPTFEAQQAAMAAQQAQMAQAGTLQSGLDLGGVGASPAAMAPGSSVPLAVTGAAPAAVAPGMSIASKAALGLGGLGLLGSLADRGRFGVPAVTPYESPLARISPDFRGYEPPRPNPYYQARYPVYGAEGGVVALANGGPVERMTAMNTAINPQGGLYPQGMIDKTQYATPSQRPASMELLDTEPSYQKSNPLVGVAGMANGGQVKGYAAGGMPDFGLTGRPVTPDLSEEAYRKFLARALFTGTPPTYEQWKSNIEQRISANAGGPGAMFPQQPTVQPTGQSTFPGAASMQGGFGQGAQGYPSFTMGSGGFGGGGGGGGAFPLEGRYGIVRMASGGISDLGGYSDGGRLLKGPGDGVSDDIPAQIGQRQPARLADGEFVVPARIVSEIGNGSTDAGARKLYAMMDRVQKARRKSMGKGRHAVDSKAEKLLPV